MHDREHLAWASGFYVGEGSIYLVTQRKGDREYNNLALAIAQVEREPLDRFRDYVGLGAVYGPYSKNTRNSNDQYVYRVSSFEKVQAVIAVLWEWLSPRRMEQATVILTSYREHERSRYKHNKPLKHKLTKFEVA